MRNFLFLLLLLSPVLQAQEHKHAVQADDFLQRALDIYLPLDTFIREYAGCPLKVEFTTEECKEEKRMIDKKLYTKMREAAKKFFDLVEPPEKKAK